MGTTCGMERVSKLSFPCVPFQSFLRVERWNARQTKNRQPETGEAEIRIRAERRIGELMAAQRQAGLLAEGAAEGNKNVEKRFSSNPLFHTSPR